MRGKAWAEDSAKTKLAQGPGMVREAPVLCCRPGSCEERAGGARPASVIHGMGWGVPCSSTCGPGFRATSEAVEMRLREGWEVLGGGWDQPLLRVPLWARAAVQSGTAGHPVQRWVGLHADPSSAGLGRGVGCRGDGGAVSPRAHSHVGSKPGESVCEIYNLTESGVLLAGEPSRGEPHFDPTQTWACCLRPPRETRVSGSAQCDATGQSVTGHEAA